MNKFHTDKFSIVYLSNLKVTRMRQTTTIHFKNGLTLKNDRISVGFTSHRKPGRNHHHSPHALLQHVC